MSGPELPEKALTLAAVAIHDVDCPDRACSGSALGHAYKLAQAALDAAEPHLTADLRKALARAEDLIAEKDRQLERAESRIAILETT